MKKIGILDSGIGGFSLLKELLDQNLDAQYFYISDNDNVPYGDKSQEFIYTRMKVLVNELLLQKVEAVLIACNTATVETIEKLRSDFKVKFIGIEPYINYLNHTNHKDIALILTEATYRSSRFKELQASCDPNGIVEIFPLKNLALIIEKLSYKNFQSIKTEIKLELDSINLSKFTELILGCTHYPLIKNFIEENYKLKCIDPNLAVIKELKKQANLLVQEQQQSKSFLYNFNVHTGWKTKDLSQFFFFN